MQVSRVDSISQFDQLQANWESVYAADSYAHIFVSWTWLRGWFAITPFDWFVLAIRPDNESPHVSFLPLILRGLRIHEFRPVRVLHLGGQPLAFYTGFVCLPEYEEEALVTFAAYIQEQLAWDSFQMEEVLDPRLDVFLQCFSIEEYDIRQSYGMPSLYIPLPDDWDSYLQNRLGPKTRRNLRRSLRKIDNGNGYWMTHTQLDTVERDIEVLLMLWQWRWGAKPMANWHRKILRCSFENNGLWLKVLWNGQTPVAALAGIVDQNKHTFYAYIVGHNDKYTKLSPGKIMFGNSIRYAIEDGFQIYDFTLGADDYKISLDARQRSTKRITIKRRGFRNTVANGIISLTRRASSMLVKILGPIKRVGIVKKLLFWLLATVKRIRS